MIIGAPPTIQRGMLLLGEASFSLENTSHRNELQCNNHFKLSQKVGMATCSPTVYWSVSLTVFITELTSASIKSNSNLTNLS